eukprot:2782395-Rhodomonas_salina.2
MDSSIRREWQARSCVNTRAHVCVVRALTRVGRGPRKQDEDEDEDEDDDDLGDFLSEKPKKAKPTESKEAREARIKSELESRKAAQVRAAKEGVEARMERC